MAVSWWAVVDDATGVLVSVGTVIPSPLPGGLVVVAMDGPPAGRSWDQTARRFVGAPTAGPPGGTPPPGGATPTIYVPGIGSGGDDGVRIQDVLDSIGTSTVARSVQVWAEAPYGSAGQCYSTVQIEHDGVRLRMAGEWQFYNQARVRMFGDLVEEPRSGIPILTANVAAGATVLHVSDVTPFTAGGKLVLRGARGKSGDPLPNQKEEAAITSLDATNPDDQIINLGEPLDNAFLAVNADPDTPIGWSRETTVSAAVGSALLSSAAAGDVLVDLVSTSRFMAGQWTFISDLSNTHTPEGAAETKNYPHKQIVEVVEIVSGTRIRIGEPLWHPIDAAQAGFAAVLVPLMRTAVTVDHITWPEMSAVPICIEGRFCVGGEISGSHLQGSPVGSWWKHGARFSDSSGCRVMGMEMRDPLLSGSGEGYGISLYGAHGCLVDDAVLVRCRHDVLGFNGASGNLVINIRGQDCRISGFDLHGGQCHGWRVADSIWVGGTSECTDGSGGVGNKFALRFGNTTHADGDAANTVSDVSVWNFPGAAVEVLPQTADTLIQGLDVRNTTVGLRILPLPRNTALVAGNTILRDSTFMDVPTFLQMTGSTDVIGGLDVSDVLLVRATQSVRISNATGVHLAQVRWSDPRLPAHAYALWVDNITGLRVDGGDMSGCPRGIKLDTCPAARIGDPTMHDLVDGYVLDDHGGNTDAWFRLGPAGGYSPAVSGAGTSSGFTIIL